MITQEREYSSDNSTTVILFEYISLTLSCQYPIGFKLVYSTSGLLYLLTIQSDTSF